MWGWWECYWICWIHKLYIDDYETIEDINIIIKEIIFFKIMNLYIINYNHQKKKLLQWNIKSKSKIKLLNY